MSIPGTAKAAAKATGEGSLIGPFERAPKRRSCGAALAVVGLLILATVAGCVVNEPESPTRGVVVSGPPPAPVREERPSPPSPQAVWVQGYWHWTGMQYAWIPGHWDAPPPGATWNAPVYSMRDGRYFYESGGWRSNGGPSANALR
jgi:hypothetical protein